MRNVPQLELGQVAIEKIDLSEDSRDDMRGIQHVYADPAVQDPGGGDPSGSVPQESASRRCGRSWCPEAGPGLDHLHELVNETVRKFPDHGDIRDNTRYSYRTVLENVSHLTPEVLEKASHLVAGSGHAMVRKRKSDGPLRGRCDSFVVRCTTRRTSTCCGMRCLVRPRSRARGGDGSGSIGAAGSAFRRDPAGLFGGWYLDDSRELERKRRLWRRASGPSGFSRSNRTSTMPAGRSTRWTAAQGEKIPQEERVFSIFEERWCVKGKCRWNSACRWPCWRTSTASSCTTGSCGRAVTWTMRCP